MSVNINGINPSAAASLRTKNESTGQAQESVNSSVRNQAEQAPARAAGEQVSLSSKAQDLKQLESSVRNLPEVDESRVARIKAALADGSYQIDHNKLAGKLLSFEEETN